MRLENEIKGVTHPKIKQFLTVFFSVVLIFSFVATPLLATPNFAFANDANNIDITSNDNTVEASNPDSNQDEATDEAQLQNTSSVTGLEDVACDWANFRNSNYNMAITDANTPISASTSNLLWAKQLTGQSMWDLPNAPIIVDNCLITTASTTLYKIDLATGETIATSTMARATDWGYTWV